MTGTKTITFAVPCYNSAAYMDKCIQSLLACGEDIEILIVDDGSTKDNTAEKADEWEARYPGIIRALHKENGGHGSAVNTGLANASGRYFKVVDSDDWLDPQAMERVMRYLRPQCELQYPTDMVVANYVYEKVHEGTRQVMHYKNVFPQGVEFTWSDTKHFNPSQYLLMHSVIYRTDLLKDMGLKLPEHCFYVDNIFVYVPLPKVRTIYYLNVDMYRYFIGREDQSVNEKVMMGRMDQQLRVTYLMIEAYHLDEEIKDKYKRRYMYRWLSLIIMISQIHLTLADTTESLQKITDIWQRLKDHDAQMYRKVRSSFVNIMTNLPGKLGRYIDRKGFYIAQKIFKFS